MICLTGDVHHDGLRTQEQLFLSSRNVSEVAASVQYVRLCEKYNVKCTLYVTGRTLADQWDIFRPMSESPLVEIGGHTFCGWPASRWEHFKARLTGKVRCSHASAPASYASQVRDVDRMMKIAQQRLNKPIVSWRCHGLELDEHTYKILARAGIKFISDDLSWQKIFPERLPEGLISHAMNVIMDHDHLIHAHRTRAYVTRQGRPFPNDPCAESYTVEEWLPILEKQVQAIEQKGGVATVLLHPLCMDTIDEFKTMERLVKMFSHYKTVWAKETGNWVKN